MHTKIVSDRDGKRQTVLVLYNDQTGATQYVREHAESLGRHSRHAIYYAPANLDVNVPWEAFDAVIIHFSVRLAYERPFSPSTFENLKAFTGVKVAFVQDEYERPRFTCKAIRELEIGGVFTTTPPECRHRFYPLDLVGPVEFHRCLTGYVPWTLVGRPRRPISERRIPIGYRGRVLPYWLGLLAREKYEIGHRVAEICRQRSLAHDIAWTEEARIYGTGWYNFLSDCRSTLGTESGANIIDWDGSLQTALTAALVENPAMTFEQAHSQFLAVHEGVVSMNQVAPKVFEAIALGTPLILYEGHHSGVVQPGEHYLPLKKDLSNIDDVLAAVADDEVLKRLADRAYADVIASGRYSYETFVKNVDGVIERLSEVADQGGRLKRRLKPMEQLECSDVASLPLHRTLPAREPYWSDPWADLVNEYRKADRLIADLDRVGAERNRAVDENHMLRAQIAEFKKYTLSRIVSKLWTMIQPR